MKIDIHQKVTDQIVEALEKGAGQWVMPWARHEASLTIPTNVDTHRVYNGINVLCLWSSGLESGFPSQLWGTYKQWKKRGCQVRKGEKGTTVVFYKSFEVTVSGEDGEDNQESRLIAKASTVFNVCQVDGYKVETTDRPTNDKTESLESVEAFIRSLKAKIQYGGPRAYYSPSEDRVQMPERASFVGTETRNPTEAFYGVLLHELTHWTSHPTRCARELGKRFGDSAYAMEELIAELGAAFLCAELGITLQPRPDHAAYVNNWLQVLKADKKAIFTAASQASKAVAYMRSLTE